MTASITALWHFTATLFRHVAEIAYSILSTSLASQQGDSRAKHTITPCRLDPVLPPPAPAAAGTPAGPEQWPSDPTVSSPRGAGGGRRKADAAAALLPCTFAQTHSHDATGSLVYFIPMDPKNAETVHTLVKCFVCARSAKSNIGNVCIYAALSQQHSRLLWLHPYF